MRKLILILLIPIFIFMPTDSGAEQPDVEVLKLGIMHTNDTHGHLLPFRSHGENDWGGVARRRVAIQRERADTNYYWLVLDAGDVFQGTPISNMLRGFLDLECMNQMGYDAMCLGNHEFDFGYELLLSRLSDVNFHVLCANVVDRERGRPFTDPYCIIRRGDYRIGIIGLTTETLIFETHPSIAEHVDVHPTLPIARSLARYLREIGCDIVIALGHQGYNRDLKLAEAVPEIDVIVGGHTHTVLDVPTKVGNVVVTQNGDWGRNLGVLKLTFERPADDPDARFNLINMENEFTPLSPNEPEDDGMKAFIADYERRFAAEMDKFICKAEEDLKIDTIRLEENALADIICDSMRGVTGADVVLFNGGNFRAPINAGDVTFGDLYGVLPYDNFMMKVFLSGERLREVYEYAGLQYGDGGFPQVSGLSVVYVDMQLAGIFIGDTPPTEFSIDVNNDTQKYAALPMNAPESGWAEIDDNAEYSLLCTDFLAQGGDGFPLDEDPYGPGYTGLEQRATFAMWAAQQRVLKGGTDGRVQFFWIDMENPGLVD